MKCRDRLSLVGIFFFLFTLTLDAGVVVGLPAELNFGNCIPFGCDVSPDAVTTFQEIYASTAFPGKMNITGIDFFNTQVLNGGLPDSGTYTFSLAYSSKLVGALDNTNPANNIAFGNQAFFSGPLPSVTGGLLSFTGTVFPYDPSLDNLLLTVTISGAVDHSPALTLDDQDPKTTAQVSRSFFGSFSGRGDGLVTQFDTSVPAGVPEPASVMLAAAALAGIAFARARTAARR